MADNTNETAMSPDESPDNLSKKKGGIRRVNNMPMYMVGAALGVFILIMVLVAKDRSDKQHQQSVATATKDGGGDSEMFAKEVAGGHATGIVPANMPTVPTLTTAPASSASAPPGVVQIAHPNLDQPPAPPGGTQEDNQRDQIQQAKFSQFVTAVRAKTAVQGEAFRSPGSAPGGPDAGTLTGDDIQARLQSLRQQIATTRITDPTTAYKEQMKLIQDQGLASSGGGGSAAPALAGLGGNGGGSASGANNTASSTGTANGIQQFAGGDKEDRWALNQSVQAPTSPYELRAGSVMPATLISGINSELPGMIMAQVSQNVYDTATGKFLLIPQGSRLVGTYASNVVYGQSRVLVAWQRIVFPDGKALDIGAMPGADGAGYAGYNDKVNNHYFRIFGSALLMSGITAGIAYSQDRNQQVSATGYTVPTASQEMSQALGQQLGMATANMLEKNLNIAPTLEIRPGFRFNVIVTKDVALTKPYQSFDY